MYKFRIHGPTKLCGSVNISRAKNSILPILFLTLLSEELIEIKDVPKLKDVDISMKLLRGFGVKIISYKNSLFINASDVDVSYIPSRKLVGSIRASIWLLAPLLSRFGSCVIACPGGCSIGVRPIDLHVYGLQKLGAFILFNGDYLKASVHGRLHGSYIKMKKISVGATITIMSAATLAVGITIIENASCEPEVVDVANFLLC